ncbi:MAG: septation protein IspZ, partial [Gammaproteobacteria bacterium]|nr:septation protein IspZ [Gammaproteobacteria bacterium]
HLITLGLLAVFGGATIWLRNPEFIMWKVTAVNWLFAIALIGSHFIGDKPLMRRLMDKQIELPQAVWSRLNTMWAGFFLTIGAINIYFALDAVNARMDFFQGAQLAADSVITEYTCNTDFPPPIASLCEIAQGFESTWVDFKFYGVLGLTILFGVGQAMYLARHIKVEEE